MYKEYLSFANKLAKDAGGFILQFILPHAVNADKQNLNSISDSVNEMDIQVENFIIHRIKEKYPDHSIFSEEAGNFIGKGDFEWVVAPIDGMVNQSIGTPLYGGSIALTYQGDPVVAAIYLPTLGELFWASKGGGAFLNGKPIKIRNTALSESFVSLGNFSKNGDNEDKESNMEYLMLSDSIANEVLKIRIVGTPSATLAYIAAGRLDAAMYIDPNRFDITAGQLLIHEAGGKQKKAGKYMIFANNKVVDELTNLIMVLK